MRRLDLYEYVPPSTVVWWKGWSTTIRDLELNGWDLQVVENRFAKRIELRIRDTKNKLIGTTYITDESYKTSVNGVSECYPLTIKDVGMEYNGRNGKAPRTITERVYTKDDVPELLGLVNDLLSESRKKLIKDKVLPTAEVVYLRKGA